MKQKMSSLLKALTLVPITFGISTALSASTVEEGVSEYDFTVANEHAYWYSRYNLGSLVMKSGLGVKFMPHKPMVKKMLAMVNDERSQAKPAQNPALLKRVYNGGNPAWVNTSDGVGTNFENFRWASIENGKTSAAAYGWTLMKEVEWSKLFNVDNHFGAPGSEEATQPGAQQRFAGLVLCVESMLQTQEFLTNKSDFDMSDLGGNYVALGALSNLAGYIGTKSSPLMAENRCAKVASMMKKKPAAEVAKDLAIAADQLYASLDEPTTVRDTSLATQSLVWYVSASQTNRSEVKERIIRQAKRLSVHLAQSPVERAYILRALIEVHRLIPNISAYDGNSIGHTVAKQYAALNADFNSKRGTFNSQIKYTVDDIAVILGALNALRSFPVEGVKVEQVLSVLTAFFEGTIEKSGLQISAPPMKALPAYEQKGEIMHRYPNTPVPPKAGGENGIAPVFAASVQFDGGTNTWSAQKNYFDTAGAMHLANEMIWMHRFEVDGFPQIDFAGEPGDNDGVTTPEPGNDDPLDGLLPTFTNVYTKIIGPRCSHCHQESFGPNNLKMGSKETAYKNLVGVPSVWKKNVKRVSPNQSSPKKSFIIAKVQKSSADRKGAQMPFDGKNGGSHNYRGEKVQKRYLLESEVDFIKAWIDLGALNN